MLTQLRCSAQILLIPLLIGSIGCQNHNLFSKLHGESSNPATLTAEASIALRNKDYGKALELANKVLADNPNNSDALYDAASAELGIAGLNLGSIVSNLSNHVQGASVAMNGVPGLVTLARNGAVSQAACGGTNSVLSGLDCDALLGAINIALPQLHKISSGVASGTIAQTDVPMLIDYGMLSILHAALLAVMGGFFDFTNDNGTFQVVTKSGLNTLCTSHPTTAISIIQDVAVSYSVFNRVASLLSLKDTSIVSQVRNDIKDSGDQVMTEGAGQILPQACFDNVFDPYNPPLNKGNYLTVFENAAFTPS